jgi:hypothetical protein
MWWQHILRASSGLDCYKLRKVNHLCNNILRDKIKRLPDAIVKVRLHDPSATSCFHTSHTAGALENAHRLHMPSVRIDM